MFFLWQSMGMENHNRSCQVRYPQRVTTALPKPLYDTLVTYAGRELLHPSTVVRQAVAFFLDAQTRKTRRGRKGTGG